MDPYICYVCRRSLDSGDMVVPVMRVVSAAYVVEIDPRVKYYAHVGCV